MEMVRLTLSYDLCDDQWIVHTHGHKDSIRFDTLMGAVAFMEVMAGAKAALAKAELVNHAERVLDAKR